MMERGTYMNMIWRDSSHWGQTESCWSIGGRGEDIRMKFGAGLHGRLSWAFKKFEM